ncbi:hypothetical protein [Streptomyces mirabilis]|jgi:hypothetical protein|uniref:Uncharacterized protein n=1 Tax=Streptomyces mirabilis TaxID=68239 RepID=A0A1I2JGG7_9ACTN|nr:hypothetical protein [Streptomyces mirabilis]SFF53359.1 hypothetical protein SAMN02787118_10873 [Streptomyces mirabilis]
MSNAVSKESLELAAKADRAPIRELAWNVERAQRVRSARAGCRVRADRPVLKGRPVRAVRPVPLVGPALRDGSPGTVG